MPTSAICSEGDKAGFSLVEALATLMIVGLLAGVALMAAQAPGRAPREAAQSLAMRLSAASQESIIRNRSIALLATPEGAGFAQREAQGWRRIEDGSPLAFRAWPEGVAVAFPEAAGGEGLVGIVFDPVGTARPGVIEMSAAGDRWRVRVDAGGRTHVEPLP